MEINHYRLSSPFNGEKSILCLDYNKEKIELPFIPQVFFPLEMAQLKEMASFPTAFFIADPSDILRAHHAKTVKIKITHLDFENGMELVKKTLVSIKAKIRIDANRTLTPEQVQILSRCIPQDRLDFFEEPTQNIEDVLDLNVPLALDESFLEPGWEKKLAYNQVVAAVIKPYRVFYRPIVDLCLLLKKRIVLSSTLEDSTPIIKLATHLKLFDEPLGIDVEKYKMKVSRCPIASTDPQKIAIRTITKDITYGELNCLIKGELENRADILRLDLRIELIAKFFWLLRAGIPIHFPLECSLTPQNLETIPLNTKIFMTSSGTTGAPKTICWSWEDLALNIDLQYKTFPTFKGASFKASLDLTRMGGLMGFLRPLLGEGFLVLDDEVEASFESVVPTQIAKRVELQKTFRAQNLLIGGARCSDSLLKVVEKWNIKPIIIYSSTELGACLIDGTPVGNCVVKRDHRGCFMIQKKGVSSSVVADSEGFFSTNDLVEIQKGLFTITGRHDRVINSGGEKIHLDTLEEKLNKFINKGSFFLFGVEDSVWGEALCIAHDSLEEKEIETLKSFLKETFQKHMIPKKWVKLPDNYPAKPPLSLLKKLIKS